MIVVDWGRGAQSINHDHDVRDADASHQQHDRAESEEQALERRPRVGPGDQLSAGLATATSCGAAGSAVAGRTDWTAAMLAGLVRTQTWIGRPLAYSRCCCRPCSSPSGGWKVGLRPPAEPGSAWRSRDRSRPRTAPRLTHGPG